MFARLQFGRCQSARGSASPCSPSWRIPARTACGLRAFGLRRVDRGGLARHGLAIAGAALAAAVAAPALAGAAALTGLLLVLLLVLALFLFEERLPVGDGDLVIVRMNFREGEESVAIAAVFDEGGLERRLHPRHLRQIDVAAERLLAGGFEIEFFDAVTAQHHHPGLFRV